LGLGISPSTCGYGRFGAHGNNTRCHRFSTARYVAHGEPEISSTPYPVKNTNGHTAQDIGDRKVISAASLDERHAVQRRIRDSSSAAFTVAGL